MRITAVLAVTIGMAFSMVGVASAEGIEGPGARAAKQACKAEREQNPGAFSEQYGGTGAAAIDRCTRQRLRQARSICRGLREENPAAFRERYANANGEKAFARCVRANVVGEVG